MLFRSVASELGLILVAPDTSPRGAGVADDADAYDLGMGAGFYINATREPWASHYRMYDYIVSELPQLIEKTFSTTSKRSIFGHSMGGHGALMIALKNPGMYQSVSAFSPIVAPSKVPWGEKAFGAYLGEEEREAWKQWDTCELVADAKERLLLFVDQGMDDAFYASQLQTERLREACEAAGHPFNIRLQGGYDHSYYFISTFIEDHLQHHASALSS